jgi:hypothetical protein
MRHLRWLWLPITLFLAIIVLIPRDDGRWQCSLCGKHEQRKIAFSITLWSRQIDSGYHKWFNQKACRSHTHDWVHVGCHQRGNMIWGMTTCSMRDFGFLEKLPQLPTEAQSLRAVDKLFSLTAHERLRELLESDLVALDPYSGEYAAWWTAHPHWQGVFPAPLKK